MPGCARHDEIAPVVVTGAIRVRRRVDQVVRVELRSDARVDHGCEQVDAVESEGNYVRLHATATNLLDQQRYQLFGGSVIGRRVLGGVTASF